MNIKYTDVLKKILFKKEKSLNHHTTCKDVTV